MGYINEEAAHENKNSTEPDITVARKYPLSNSVPENSPNPNKSPSWIDPIQLIADGDFSVSDIRYS